MQNNTHSLIEEFVREVTSIRQYPPAKSEVQARIEQILEAQKYELRDDMLEKMADWSGTGMAMVEDYFSMYLPPQER